MADQPKNEDYIEIKVPKDEDVPEVKEKEPQTEAKPATKPTSKPKKKVVKKKKTAKRKKPSSTPRARKKQDSDGGWIWVLLIVVGIIIIGAVIYLSLKSTPTNVAQENQEETKIAALVNNEPIYVNEIDDIYDRLPANIQAQTEKETVLDQLIDQTVLLQETKSAGIEVSDEELDEFTQELLTFFGVNEDQLVDLLDAQGLSREEFDESNKRQIAITKLINESVYKNLDVTDEEIQKYYDENAEQFTTSPAHVVKHILVQPQDNETDNETMDRAADIEDLIEDDFSNFCQLVEEHSQDQGSLANCGEYTVRADGTYVPEFEAAAVQMDADEIRTVKTVFGYHIMWKVEQTQGGQTPIAEVEEAIGNTLFQQKANVAVQEFVKELRDQSTIEKYPVDGVEEVKTNPQTVEEEVQTQETMQVEVEETQPVRTENFGECLADRGAVYYGVAWSPDVKEQKEILGDAAASVPYIECDATENPQAPADCSEITVYPTWFIGDEQKNVLIGKQSINSLSRETGCAI